MVKGDCITVTVYDNNKSSSNTITNSISWLITTVPLFQKKGSSISACLSSGDDITSDVTSDYSGLFKDDVRRWPKITHCATDSSSVS